MKEAQKPDHMSLNNLVEHLKEGRFVVPDFQRDFEWRPWDISALMRSIFLDYYIGSLLLWKSKKQNITALSCEPIYGYTGASNPEHIILDGQQRLTAMYYAFVGPDKPLPNRVYRAIYHIRVDKFMAEEYDQAFDYEWYSKRWAKILANAELQYSQHLFPLNVIGVGGWELGNWVQRYEQFWRDAASKDRARGDAAAGAQADHHAQNAHAFGKELKSITEQYQVAYIELDRDLEIDKVCDIFTQINSKGIRLDAFDLMNALLKPKGLQLKKMWREAMPRLDFIPTDRMNVYILQVMSILRQAYCSPKYLYHLIPGQPRPVRDPDGSVHKQVIVSDTDDFSNLWQNAVASLESSIKRLRQPQEFGVIASRFLPYDSILPVFAALYAHIKTLPPAQRLDAHRKLDKWYWASVFTNRYSGSVESTSARDFLDVKAWFDNDAARPALLLDLPGAIQNLDLRKETKSGTSTYNGIFNLLVIQGARDWGTGNVPQPDDLDDHHIIPQSWGRSYLQGDIVHTILNRTPLTADTNRNVINDDLPNVYLPRMIAQNGQEVVRSILQTHFISPAAQAILMRDPFTPADFDEFLGERQRTLVHAIESLLIKQRLDLDPSVRELDEQIEKIELALRELISTTLANDPAKLPPHIIQRTDERIQSDLRKNPALDPAELQALPRRLTNCDLRELQDIITNRPLWPLFETRFGTKEVLGTKFSQFAELRNAIRHSRPVTEITSKEGEAAILWFNQLLQK